MDPSLISICMQIELDTFLALKSIRDPEVPGKTLDDLEVISPDRIVARPVDATHYVVLVTLKPTQEYCSQILTIGLAVKLQCEQVGLMYLQLNQVVLHFDFLVINHQKQEEMTKQVNDKERTAGALENPDIRKLVNKMVLID